MRVFIDSGGWLSVLIQTDRFYQTGTDYFRHLVVSQASLATTDFVLDEVITRLRYDVGHQEASEFLALVHDATDSGALAIHRITEELWNAAEASFLRYTAARLSFTDCTSFSYLAEQPADEVFGYDAHFEMMGYVLKPKRG